MRSGLPVPVVIRNGNHFVQQGSVFRVSEKAPTPLESRSTRRRRPLASNQDVAQQPIDWHTLGSGLRLVGLFDLGREM